MKVYKKHPILSFDGPQFLERGELMSREQILSRLARTRTILHSMPPLGRDAIKLGKCRVENPFPNLFTYRNPPWLPRTYRFPVVEKQSLWVRALHRRFLLNQRQSGRPIIYIWHPFFAEEIGRYRELLVVYHMYDDYRSYPNPFPGIAELEHSVLRRADVVISISKSLISARSAEVPRSYFYVPLGIDFDLYRTCHSLEPACPDDLAQVPQPRIGYVGRLNAKVDMELVMALAQNRPDWNFVLVGPTCDEVTAKLVTAATARGNVYFLGEKLPRELPAYYYHMDVNTMCYKSDNKGWYRHIHPLKMYELLAIGKPIVSTPLEEIRQFGDVIYFAKDVAEWLLMIQSLLEAGEDPQLKAKRVRYAERSSWDARVEEIDRILDNALERKAGGGKKS